MQTSKYALRLARKISGWAYIKESWNTYCTHIEITGDDIIDKENTFYSDLNFPGI